jgi:hypothetical protein
MGSDITVVQRVVLATAIIHPLFRPTLAYVALTLSCLRACVPASSLKKAWATEGQLSLDGIA